jgi:hypothetical protein
LERLTSIARRRGTTVSGIIREVLTQWEKAEGLVDSPGT